MSEPINEMRVKFKGIYDQLRVYEKLAEGMRPGDEAHREIMSKVFEAEDSLFELATLMLCLYKSSTLKSATH